jgi:hypothetical protein
MLKRMSTNALLNMKSPSSGGSSYPKLGEILVNLSTKEGMVERKLKLVGDPIGFLEYTDKVYVPGQKGKTQRVPFPDADINKGFTRIGHEDPNQCPWKAAGYIPTMKFAQNVLEQQADGTWVPKILKAGKSIFLEFAKWQSGRINDLEDLDEDEVEGFITHLGTRRSMMVRVKAIPTGKEPPQSVEYAVSVGSKEIKVTDEMVEALKAAGEPKPEVIEEERKNYNADRAQDPTMPEWEDFFTYGYDLKKIFKFQPIKVDAATAELRDELETSYVVKSPVAEQPKPVATKNEDDDDEDDIEPVVVATKAKAKKPVVVEEDDSDDSESNDDWM